MKSKHLFGLLGALFALILTFAPATRGENPPPPAPTATAVDNPAPPPAVQPAKPEVAAAPTATETPAPTPAAPAADKPAPPPEAPPAKPETAATTTAAESSAPAPEAAKPSAAPAPETELRRLDTEVAPASSETSKRIHDKVKKAVERHARMHRGDGSGERVNFGQDSTVGKDEKVETAVSIIGSTTVNGEVNDAAVSIMGTTTVDGSVGGDAVAVMGSVRVNGTVHGQVVAVGGDVDLGPNSEVFGEIVSVGGAVHRDPGAVVHGNVQQVSFMKHFPKFDWLYAWMQSALFKGRLLSFASGAGWAWLVAGAALGFYVLLALIFPRSIEKCAVTLEEHPGYSILTAFLTMLAMPLVFLLLAITGIGLIVIPFLGLGLFGCRVFGRATMLAWFGRRITGMFGEGPWAHAAVSVLIGGVLVMMLYLVPILAFIVAMLIGFLGLGTVIYTILRSMRRNGAKPAPAGAIAPPAAGTPAVVAAVPLAAGSSGDVAGAAAVPPIMAAAPGQPVISAATLPRAGFGIRTAALLIDVILCGMVLILIPFVHFGCGVFLLILAAYGAVMWELRGTTVGGSICHLKVVRIDDRPLDWTCTIVRALSCFLSLIVVGLGFLWVAFDDEKQSWHDKIAGTVVVQVPKSVALI
jgi:uncharacterized RDD family membrane protein YckC/cytoskeletal protein CcmA (bactofilin family)